MSRLLAPTRKSRKTHAGMGRPLLLCAGIASALTMAHAHAVDAAAPANGGATSAVAVVDAQFDRNLLSGAGANTTDISRFERGNPVLPGIYNIDIYLNQAWVGRSNVRFVVQGKAASATPCVDRKLLDQLGLHPDKLSADTLARLDAPGACLALGELIPDATLAFDQGSLRLDASVPQAYLDHAPRGYVSPEYWDAGVPAALLNYNFNGYRSTNNGRSLTNGFLGLNTGINVGLWHVRYDATASWQSSVGPVPSRRHWQNIRSYVQRDLPSLGAQLIVGDSYTDGQVFDSFAVRGVQLATDDRMLPDSVRGYAPVIRGTAESNARVVVRQNGVEIYQTTVAPGPFSINDLYPTGYGGNLDVSVIEADGRVRTFSVPYASVAQLLRPGTTRFSVVAGQLRNPGIEDEPNLVQATVQRGFNNMLTGYAGLIGAQGYGAVLVGSALNTRYGAVALDITQAHASIPGLSAQNGQSVRVSYSKILPQTDTTLTVAAYRYSTSGYLSFADAALARDYARRGLDAFRQLQPTPDQMINGVPVDSLLTPAQRAALSGSVTPSQQAFNSLQRQRNRFDLTLNQRLGDAGGVIYTNVSASDYWSRKGTDTQFQLGYSNTFRNVTYGLSATRSRNFTGRYSNEYFLNISVPLGDTAHAPTFMLNVNRDSDGNTQEQAMINGALGADNAFNYGVAATHNDTTGNSGAVNVGYRSPYALLNASYGEGNHFSQASVGASGAVVVHPGGITFGQPMGDTVGIIEVPNAEGARVTNAVGAKINANGYALVPYLTPYKLNVIQVDPKGLPLDVQLDATSARVAPVAGAVVMVKFDTHNGRLLMVHAHTDDGQALPFGTEIFNAQGASLGMVGQSGRALLQGVDNAGQLTARWQDGDGHLQSCVFSYQLKPAGQGKKRKQVGAASLEDIEVSCARSSAGASLARNP